MCRKKKIKKKKRKKKEVAKKAHPKKKKRKEDGILGLHPNSDPIDRRSATSGSPDAQIPRYPGVQKKVLKNTGVGGKDNFKNFLGFQLKI